MTRAELLRSRYEIDENLGPIYQKFLDSLPERIDHLETYMNENNRIGIQREAADLYETASKFGLLELGDRAETIQRNAKVIPYRRLKEVEKELIRLMSIAFCSKPH